MTTTTHEPPLIEFRGVKVQFGRQVVHNNLSFTVSRGEGITILGPSGTGKTLILKMIIGLLQPSEGQVTVCGTRMDTLCEEELIPVRARIGMLFQGAALFDSLTVSENIAYPLREAGVTDERAIEARVAETLEVVGLAGIQPKLPGQLSGGQRKRVGLARALARKPEILLFDEPTTGLDPTATRLIDDLIVKLRREMGITSIAVTHDIASAMRISNRWILIDSGRVLADGPAEHLSHNNAEVVNFISGNWKED